MIPQNSTRHNGDFVEFVEFHAHSRVLDDRNTRLKMQRLNPMADVIKERATRSDIVFRDVMQAELVIFLCATLTENCWWYPNTLVFAGYGPRFPLFVRAAQHKHFQRIKIITGVTSADDLRSRFKKGCERLEVARWTDFRFHADVSFWNIMNMDALDTIK